jgi:hypothetical protein
MECSWQKSAVSSDGFSFHTGPKEASSFLNKLNDNKRE